MSIRDSDRGSELSPDCTWQNCSLFELSADRMVTLQPDGDNERWLLIRGKATASGNGGARQLQAPEVLQLPVGATLRLQVSGPAVLLRYRVASQHGDSRALRA